MVVSSGFDPVGRRVVQRAANPDAVGIAARQQRRARRRADRLGHVEVGEPDALGGHAVEVRRLRTAGIGPGAEAADVGVAKVVGKDDDDSSAGVGPPASLGAATSLDVPTPAGRAAQRRGGPRACVGKLKHGWRVDPTAAVI